MKYDFAHLSKIYDPHCCRQVAVHSDQVAA